MVGLCSRILSEDFYLHIGNSEDLKVWYGIYRVSAYCSLVERNVYQM